MPVRLKVIVPDGSVLDTNRLEANLAKAANKVISGVERDFKATYPKPKYQKRKASPGNVKASVWSTDDILRYNVRGTRPHMIVARQVRVLRFQTGYRRKVLPGRIGRRSGGPFGPTVFAKAVRHPGQEGTDVDKTIAKKWQPLLVKETKEAVKQSLR